MTMFLDWRSFQHLDVKMSRPHWSTSVLQCRKRDLSQCWYVFQSFDNIVVDLPPINYLDVCPQPTESDRYHALEVEMDQVVSVSWTNLETPPWKELPGCLEEELVEGPPSCFKVEERFCGFRMGIGALCHDIDEVTVWDIHQEEWENAMIDTQWE